MKSFALRCLAEVLCLDIPQNIVRRTPLLDCSSHPGRVSTLRLPAGACAPVARMATASSSSSESPPRILGTPLARYHGGGARLDDNFDLETWKPSQRVTTDQQQRPASRVPSDAPMKRELSKDSMNRSYDSTMAVLDAEMATERHESSAAVDDAPLQLSTADRAN